MNRQRPQLIGHQSLGKGLCLWAAKSFGCLDVSRQELQLLLAEMYKQICNYCIKRKEQI